MKSKLFLILFLASIGFILSGCASGKEMREEFKHNKYRILTDAKGNKYLVKHHIGGTYTVELYDNIIEK